MDKMNEDSWKQNVGKFQRNQRGIWWQCLDWEVMKSLGEAAESLLLTLALWWKHWGEGQWPGQSVSTYQLHSVVVQGQNNQWRLESTWWPLLQDMAPSIGKALRNAELVHYLTYESPQCNFIQFRWYHNVRCKKTRSKIEKMFALNLLLSPHSWSETWLSLCCLFFWHNTAVITRTCQILPQSVFSTGRWAGRLQKPVK